MSLKFTEDLCVMTMKNNTKVEEEHTSRFKIDMRNFTNFDPNTQKSKKFYLYYLSTYFLSYKSTEELPFMILKRYANLNKN